MSTEIESLELRIVSDSTKAAQGIDALTQSLTKLKGATQGLGLSGVAKDIGKVSDATKKTSESNANASKSFTDLYYKVKTAANGFKAVGQTIYSYIKKSSDYVENVNLFTVSMGEYASEAKAYAESVGDAMGIDPGEWMRNQGIFMTLATGFGVAGDRAAKMSENLTQLGYDLSSFYNISVDDAMQKIKSGFAGELEPLRAVGYDLSQAKLEATALALGIDKSVSSMTQAEKAQLRYYAIMTQVTTVQGDMARTLESPANQLKVFKAQVNMAAREIGNIFIPALNSILPYAIAVVKVIGSLANTIASLFGYEMPDMSESTGKVVENTDAMKENLEKGQEEAKKLKSYMLGFDELNVINPTEDSASDTSVGEEFDFTLPEYDFLNGLVERKVATIVEEMKEWLGITDDINSWSELMDTRLGTILKTVGLIGLGIAAWKVTKSFMDSITALNTLLSTPSYAIAISVILTVTGFTIAFDGMDDAIENGLDGFNFAEIVGGSLLGAGGAALLGSKIATWISTAFAGSGVANALSTAATNLGVGSAAAAGGAIAAGIAGIVLGIPTYFVGIYDAIKNGIDWLSATLIPMGATATGAGIGAIVGAAGGPLTAGIGALIGLAVGLISDFTIWFWQKFDEIEAWFEGLPAWGKALVVALGAVFGSLLGGIPLLVTGVITAIKKWDEIVPWVNNNVIKPVVKFFKGLWKSVSGFFVNLWNDIVGIWNSVATWFNETVIQPVAGFFEGLWQSVSGFFVQLWEDIVAVWNAAPTWFNETVIQPVVGFFQGLWTSVAGFFSSLWEDIVGVWNTVATWFDENVIQPIVGFFEGATMRIGQFFEGCWIIIQAVWLIASTWFNENVIQPIVGFFQGLWESVSGFFVQLWADIVAVWTLASTWFDENVIQPVVGFFKGLWESVSGFFVQLWTDITTLWLGLPEWFNEFVVTPVVNFFKGLWESVSGFFRDLWNDIKKIWKDVATWFNETIVMPIVEFFRGLWTSVASFFSSLWEDIKTVWNGVCNWFSETIIEPVKNAFDAACKAIGEFFSSLWLSIRQGVANAMNGVISGIESAINWVIGGINSLISGFNDVVQWAADIIGEDWGGVTLVNEVHFQRVTVPQYAEGGFPEQGQMFIAREAGAEMVGSIGRRTAVANNDQIVSGIAGGVAEANEEQNALLREQNSLLRAILEKDSGVYLDGKNLTNSVEKYQRERGRVLITGGVV